LGDEWRAGILISIAIFIAMGRSMGDGGWGMGDCGFTKFLKGIQGVGQSVEVTDASCIHLAPIASVELGARAKLRYRYWMVVGTEKEIGESIDVFLEKFRRLEARPRRGAREGSGTILRMPWSMKSEVSQTRPGETEAVLM
jgi:hypothetical protein